MAERITNKQIMETMKAFMEAQNAFNQQTAEEIKELRSLIKPTEPKKGKKASPKEKKTREEGLTEAYGDKAKRTKFIELRNKVAAEFKELAVAGGKYIPKKKYADALNEAARGLEGKRYSKAAVKAVFEKYAK